MLYRQKINKLLKESIVIPVTNLSNSQIKLIKDIEKKSYPSFMRSFDSLRSKQDIIDYVTDGEDYDEQLMQNIKIVISDSSDWYMIFTINNYENMIEVQDLAGHENNSNDIKKSLNKLNEIIEVFKPYKGMSIKADFRETTSYRLIKLLEKKQIIQIQDERKWSWGNETMIEVEFIIIDIPSSKVFESKSALLEYKTRIKKIIKEM
jgi:hypothetical protein